MKKIIYALLLIIPFVNSTAQNPDNDGRRTYTIVPAHSWQFGLSVGTGFYLGDHDWEAKFKDWWTFPMLNLSMTYWTKTCWGFGGDIFYRRYKGLGSTDDNQETFGGSDAPLYSSNTNFLKSTGSYMGFIANGCLDVARCFGWNFRKEFQIVAFAGLGVVVAAQSNSHRAGWTMQAGLRNQWELSTHWNIDAIICGSIISDKFDGKYASISEHNVPADGTMTLLLGFTYKM